MPFNCRRNEQIMAYPYNGILFSNEKEQRTDRCYNIVESQKHFVKGKQPDREDYILYKNWQIYRDRN